MRTLKISKMFIRVNFKKTISSIVTLITFLLILNIILGILFSITGMFSDTVAKNISVHYMEIIDEDSRYDIEEVNLATSKVDGIDSSFIDVSHPILLEYDNDKKGDSFTLVGVPKKMLKEMGVDVSSDKYLFLPEFSKETIGAFKSVNFSETLYQESPDGIRLAKNKIFEYKITGYFTEIPWDLLPEKIAIIDEQTAMNIAKNMSEDRETLYSNRVISYVEDVSKIHDVANKIEEQFPGVEVRYALKYTGQLPSYATAFIAVSGIIIAILLIFTVINIRSNVKQTLNIRHRDIALLSLFGVRSKQIINIFVLEFLASAVISFIFAFSITIALFGLFKYMFTVDLLTDYWEIYLVTDLAFAIGLFILIVLILVSSYVRKLNKSKIYKELLK